MQTNLEQLTEIISSLLTEDFDRAREVFSEQEKSDAEKNDLLAGKLSIIKRRGNGWTKTARNLG